LNLEGNYIKEVKGWTQFNLEEFWLGYNNLTTFTGNNFSSLRLLDLTRN
jgi:Leucine-rich repeat (LRR) protein